MRRQFAILKNMAIHTFSAKCRMIAKHVCLIDVIAKYNSRQERAKRIRESCYVKDLYSAKEMMILQRDPAFRKRIKEKKRQRKRRRKRLLEEQKPIIQDLRKSNIRTSSLNCLCYPKSNTQRYSPHSRATAILVEHLQKEYMPLTIARITEALLCRPNIYNDYFSKFLLVFHRCNNSSSLENVIRNRLAVLLVISSKRKDLPVLLKLIEDDSLTSLQRTLLTQGLIHMQTDERIEYLKKLRFELVDFDPSISLPIGFYDCTRSTRPRHGTSPG